MTLGVGLMILRIGFGVLLAGHGCQKLFGWFRGHGLAGTGAFFDTVGYRPGRYMAALAGGCELLGGLLIAFGLLTPLGAAIALGTMIAAANVHVSNGLWASDGGFELPGAYALAAAGLAFTGPGKYSLDDWLGLNWNWRYGLAAVLVAALAAAAAILGRGRQLHRSSSTTGTAGQSASQAVPVQRHKPSVSVPRYSRVRATFVSSRVLRH